jgi:hypothetical protein
MDTADFPAAPNTPPSDTPPFDTPPSDTPPPAPAPPSPARPSWRDPHLLLVLAAAVQYVAFFLPWEHLREGDSAVPGGFVTVDVPVYSLFLRNPGQTYAALLLAPTLSHMSLASVFWDVLWHAALPTLGLLLALALLLWTRRAARMLFAFLSVLWLVVTSARLVNFALTILSIRAGNTHFAPRSVPDWWQLLTGTGVTISGQLPSFAYGYWLFALATLACWLALAQTVRGLLRPAEPTPMPPAYPAAERARLRLRRLAPALLTLGVALWLAGLLTLPILTADCAHPLRTLPASTIQQCQAAGSIYALQIPPAWAFLQPRPAHPFNPGDEELGVLLYFRDFALLVLAMAAALLALAAAWTAGATRTHAAALTAWAALTLAETGLLFWTLSELATLLSHPTPNLQVDFAFGPGPAAFLVLAGVLLTLVAVALYWRAALRRR